MLLLAGIQLGQLLLHLSVLLAVLTGLALVNLLLAFLGLQLLHGLAALCLWQQTYLFYAQLVGHLK